MTSRPHLAPFLSNSVAIRQEIQRFESVHPSIYAIYDLIELVPDPLVAQQIRDHVVCIEDSFVNSQEWTLSRAVPDLRLGIVGSLASGKSALVHRYLTGSYMQEESPEGGRFKKEILVDGQSYLLLIRDEGGPPELQFTAWVDAVIFVFSLENEASFNAIYNYYTKMAHFRSAADIPLILVGTQDAISENNPRVIDDARARKLATDLKRCSYYETCATYGLNVERVFQDACQKIVQQRLSSSASCLTPTNSRPSTPNSHFSGAAGAGAGAGAGRLLHASPTSNGFLGGGGGGTSSSAGSPAGAGLGAASPSHAQLLALAHKDASGVGPGGRPSLALPGAPPPGLLRDGPRAQPIPPPQTPSQQQVTAVCEVVCDNNNGPAARDKFGGVGPPPPQGFDNLPPPPPPPAVAPPSSLQPPPPPAGKDGKDLPTPSSTPTTSRKSRRRSNLFTPSKKGDDKLRNGGCELGSGRAIPLKQGYLYKRSSKALNKEWKKKYVTLCDDGRLTYHPSLHDYMDDVHGKEIPLQYVTVKVPGQRPRGSKAVPSTQPGGNGLADGLGSLTISSFQSKEQRRQADKVLLTAFELLREPGGAGGAEDAAALASSALAALNGCALDAKAETPNVKKRHRRMKSSGLRGGGEGDDSDGYEFFIVSLDNKQWHFEAGNSEERDEWVAAIEQQILTSLQGNESGKAKSRLAGCVDAAAVQAVRSRVPGNSHCADCDAPNPDWASLNLGVVVCIECSGIHRNLGSHISRVRSLDLDEWPPGHLSVMLTLGNALANSVWETHTRGRAKPTPNSSREEKERWIRSKYEAKEFLTSAPAGAPLAQQLLEAVRRGDMKSLALLLAHASTEQVNATVSARDLRTPLHIACATGSLAAVQLLLWHNANAKAVDHEGRSCLAYARASANVTLSKAAPSGPVGGAGVGEGCGLAAAALTDLLAAHGCCDAGAGAGPGAGGTLPRPRASAPAAE